jgi:hypothetical protein
VHSLSYPTPETVDYPAFALEENAVPMYSHTVEPHNSPQATIYPEGWANCLVAVPKLKGHAIKEYQQLRGEHQGRTRYGKMIPPAFDRQMERAGVSHLENFSADKPWSFEEHNLFLEGLHR